MSIKLQRKIGSVRGSYPSLEVISASSGNSSTLLWEGWLQPIRSIENLSAILSDIENGRAVIISNGGNIIHDPKCSIVHSDHRLGAKITSSNRLFKIRVEDFCNGRMPFATLLEPEITDNLRRHTLGSNGICAFEPWTYPWDENTSSIAEFIDHCIIWLFKWNVFAHTGEWIGKETPHDAKFLLGAIAPSQACYCGSGGKYYICHRLTNLISRFGRGWIFFEAWLRRHDGNIERFWNISPFRKDLKTYA